MFFNSNENILVLFRYTCFQVIDIYRKSVFYEVAQEWDRNMPGIQTQPSTFC